MRIEKLDKDYSWKKPVGGFYFILSASKGRLFSTNEEVSEIKKLGRSEPVVVLLTPHFSWRLT